MWGVNAYRECVNKVLIVDDDRTVGEVLLQYLQRAGCAGRHVTTACGLWDALRAGPPDLLVLDVMLPDGDGIDLCRRIRETVPDLPIILLTARAEGLRDVVIGSRGQP
jgi:DNA-binding response OmpR family regulator